MICDTLWPNRIFLHHTLNIWWANVILRARAHSLMIEYITNGIYSTWILTWITTFLIETSFIACAIWVNYTFRICADAISILQWTYAIWTTCACFNTFSIINTFNKRISYHILWTSTYRVVINYMTFCSISTYICTRINTFIIYTWSISGAIWINCAFEFATIIIGRSIISLKTFTNRWVISRAPANCIYTTGCWMTWIEWFNFNFKRIKKSLVIAILILYSLFKNHTSIYWTLFQGIPRHSNWTCANGCMIYNGTTSLNTTNSGARINTFISDTRSIFTTFRIRNTLGSATSVRISNLIGKTFTNSEVITDSTMSIISTRRWLTHIWLCFRIYWKKMKKWIMVSEIIYSLRNQTREQ